MVETQKPQRDRRVRDLLKPERVVWTHGGIAAGDHETLLRQEIHQATFGARFCRCAAGDSMLLDFGRELHGGVRLTVRGTADGRPARVRIRFGESASEAMADPFPVHGHAIHDHQVTVPWMGSAEIGQTGFRFVRIDAIDALELTSVLAVFLHLDIPLRGRFRCPDPLLERIWSVGAETVRLCMQDHLWDGIKRDRLVWIGDMHPETMVVATAFGADPVVTRSLDLMRDVTPLPEWMNGISSYSLWWILIQRTWWLHAGDRAYLAAQHAYLAGLCDLVLSRIGPDGAEHLDGMRFLDWPTSSDQPAIHAGLQGLALQAMDAAGELADALGDQGLAARCRAGAGLMRRHRPAAPGSKQASALLALAGLADRDAIERDVLGREPLRGISTFYGYYVLEARAAAGSHAACLEVIRRYWGAMLELGATTFWEDFDLDWVPGACGIDRLVAPGQKDIHADFGAHCYKGLRHSLCHGWAAGPTAWLSAHVLGITPAAPGFSQVRIRPSLGGLPWAEGSFPTPHGDIHVRHEADGAGGVRSEIRLPPGVTRVDGPAGG